MKKFFTLIACALVAGSAFAQDYDDPVDVITNGTIEWNNLCSDGDFSKYPEKKLVNFKVNEWVDGVKVNVGTARFTVDPVDASKFADAVLDQGGFTANINYCLEVCSRDPEIDPESGEAKSLDAWDTQLFITIGDTYLADGDKVQLKMSVKAEKPAKGSTQAHNKAGDYNWYSMVGDINFTTEWAPFESDEITLSSQQAYGQNGDKPGFATIAINLAELKEANKYYFDNIELIVTKQKIIEADEPVYDKTIPEGFEEITVNGDFEGEGIANYTCHDWIDGAKVEFADPRIIADPSNANNKCVVVTTPASPANAWQAQFFITDPKHHFYVGDVVRLRMRVKADEKQSSDAQYHAGPGSFLAGGIASVKFVKDFWTNYDSGDITVSNAKFQTIALNLSTLKAGNNVYFDDIQLIVKRADPLAAAKSDLETAIAKGNGASTFQKTEASLGALEQAVTEGELTYDDAEATKADLEAAAEAIDKAFDALAYVDGYTPLSADMYKDYTDAANPVATKCLYKIYESVDCTYGDGTAPEKKYADVSDFDELILVCGDNTAPRIIINKDKGEEAIDITVGSETPSPYLITLDDPQYGYVIDLAAIVKDQGYAHLNAIRKPGNDAGITAVDMVLGKGTATSITEAKAQKVAKAIFNVAGQQIKSLQKGLNIVDGKKIFVK